MHFRLLYITRNVSGGARLEWIGVERMKRSEGLFVTVTVLSVFHASPGFADTPGASANARCVIVALRLGEIRDASVQMAGLTIAYYYLGRLDALSPKPDLEELIAKEGAKMTADDIKSESVRCGSEFKEKAKELQVVGQHLTERLKEYELEKQQNPH
jgi:hypothetical protein